MTTHKTKSDAMLSFNAYDNGKPIAIIKGGKYHNKILYLNKKTNESGRIEGNPFDNVDGKFLEMIQKRLSGGQLREVKNILKYGGVAKDDVVHKVVSKIKKEGDKKSLTEFKIHDNGILQPLPNFKKTERAYIAGPTESGKSYFAKKYLAQLVKVHPNKAIYLFSDVKNDPELDVLPNIVRINLDEEFLEDPPNPELYRNGIALFDDIDSIQNPKIYRAVQNLRDSLLRRGRHENITTLITSHLMTNYKDTRIILNEANSIVFFPRAGATEAIRYTLKKYAGMSNDDLNKALDLPSRWVMVYKSYPSYVLYEKGAYIL